MKVMMTVHGYPLKKMGGVGLYVEALTRIFQKSNVSLALLAPITSNRWNLRIERFKWGLAYLIEQPPIQEWKQTWFRPELSNLLQTTLSNWNPDVLHIHHHNDLSLHLHEILPSKTKIVITLHDYALPCARGQLYNPNLGICSGPSPAKCVVCLSSEIQHTPLTNILKKHLPQKQLEQLKILHLTSMQRVAM